MLRRSEKKPSEVRARLLNRSHAPIQKRPVRSVVRRLGMRMRSLTIHCSVPQSFESTSSPRSTFPRAPSNTAFLQGLREVAESIEREVETFAEGRQLFAEDAAERFVFSAVDFDADTPLMHDDKRAFDPNTGQFLSTDPVEHDTENAYRYAAPNPTNCVDPTGL